ncbi:MAG: hypothetical protein JJT94_05560 [Bernardetiaceae bacterium]|nr:hypothetical protein [Bernardetiaceae bacterium]
MQLSNLKVKFFWGFLIYAAFSFLLTIWSFSLFRNTELLEETVSKLYGLENSSLSFLRMHETFLLQHTRHVDFFSGGKNELLEQQKVAYEQIDAQMSKIHQSLKKHQIPLTYALDSLQQQLHDYQQTFERLLEELQKRGAGNFGLEGKIENTANSIEQNISEPNALILFLALRKQEKEYVITQDSAYIQNWEQLLSSFQNIEKDKQQLLLLKEYSTAFRNLVRTINLLGFPHKRGISKRLVEQSYEIEHLLHSLRLRTELYKQNRGLKLRYITLVLITLSVIVTLLLGLSIPYIIKEVKREQIEKQASHSDKNV